MEPLTPNSNNETLPQDPSVSIKKEIAGGDESIPSAPSMQSFSPDLAEELRKHQGAAMKIAMMEEEKRKHEQDIISDDPKKNIVFFSSGIAVLLVAIILAVGAYWYDKNSKIVPVVESKLPTTSIVKSEDLTVLNVTNKSTSDIALAFADLLKNSKVQTGMIENVYVTQGSQGFETRLTSNMFLSALKSHITIDFSHALIQDYMVGIYQYNQPNLFVVLRGTQHDFMLAGMLQWEPYILEDMGPIFGIDVSGDNSYLINSPVVETLIENHDTRAVLDKNGKPVIFYSFLDENTVVITNDSKTLSETVRRMSL